MTHCVKSYDLADAMAAISLMPADTSEGELKGILAVASDVPPHRLDACFAGIKDMLPTVHNFVVIARMALGHQPSVGEMREFFELFQWNDDNIDKTTTRLRIEAMDGTAEITINRGADKDKEIGQ